LRSSGCMSRSVRCASGRNDPALPPVLVGGEEPRVLGQVPTTATPPNDHGEVGPASPAASPVRAAGRAPLPVTVYSVDPDPARVRALAQRRRTLRLRRERRTGPPRSRRRCQKGGNGGLIPCVRVLIMHRIPTMVEPPGSVLWRNGLRPQWPPQLGECAPPFAGAPWAEGRLIGDRSGEYVSRKSTLAPRLVASRTADRNAPQIIEHDDLPRLECGAEPR
jgi:hypothetical protein